MHSPATVGEDDGTAHRARWAVALLFLVNGLTFANIVPWLPSIKTQLGLSNTAFGVAIAAGPLGALLFGALAGVLISRFGSGRAATGAAVVTAAALPAVAVAPTWLVFAASMFVLGAGDAIADASMNAHALRVQRRYGRSIVNGFHALWSVGAVAGGLVGAVAVGLDVSRPAHLTVAAVVLVVAILAGSRWLLPGPEHTERAEEAHLDGGAGGLRQAIAGAPLVLLGLGLLLMMSSAVEDTGATWAAVYLRDVTAATPFVAGMGFVAMQVLMVIGRLGGDRVVDRFGAARVTALGSLLAAIGMALTVAVATPAAAIVGFGLAGLGVSTLFPLGLAAAGEVPGVRSGDGVTIVSWLARVGFLVVPPLIGVVADATTLRHALLVVVLAGLVAAGLGRGLLHDRG